MTAGLANRCGRGCANGSSPARGRRPNKSDHRTISRCRPCRRIPHARSFGINKPALATSPNSKALLRRHIAALLDQRSQVAPEPQQSGAGQRSFMWAGNRPEAETAITRKAVVRSPGKRPLEPRSKCGPGPYTCRYGCQFKRNPGSCHSMAPRCPSCDRVTYAVRRSGPPKQRLVTPISGTG